MGKGSEDGEKPRTKVSRSTKAALRLNDPAKMRRCSKCNGTFSDTEQCPACLGNGGVNLGNI